jgi:hypothetical protein
MRSLLSAIVASATFGLASGAAALTIEQPVTRAYLKEHAKEFSLSAEKRNDGLVHFKLVRQLKEPRSLVGHFKVHAQDGMVVESHSPAFVREKSATYHFVVSPKHLKFAQFELSEHGFDDDEGEPFPWIGGTIYQFRLADFAPREGAESKK